MSSKHEPETKHKGHAEHESAAAKKDTDKADAKAVTCVARICKQGDRAGEGEKRFKCCTFRNGVRYEDYVIAANEAAAVKCFEASIPPAADTVSTCKELPD